MPSFRQHDWNGYRIKVLPNDLARNAIYYFLHHEIIPYLWGADIYCDLEIETPKQHDSTEIISYEWECFDSNDKEILKIGKGILVFSDVKPSRKAKGGDVVKRARFKYRKWQAVNLGCISKTDHYELKMKFSNKAGVTSEQMSMAEFTIKDRDDYYMQFLWPLVGAVIAIVAGVIGYMLGVK